MVPANQGAQESRQGTDAESRVAGLLAATVVWDNHACMPMRPGDESFLPQLQRHRQAGFDFVSLNVGFDIFEWRLAFEMLATFRSWIQRHPGEYRLVDTVADIRRAKAEGKLAVAFDVEGGNALDGRPELVESYYRLGVRWMLLAYNKNNDLAGGCQDADSGLTDLGRRVIDEMERVGMVLCCSHMGQRSAREAIEYSRHPVIFSHSNPQAVHAHPRNISDDLIRACAQSGGVVSVNGFGLFLGDNDNSTETLLRHIEHVADVAGPAHVGLGLDYLFDVQELDEFMAGNPQMYPADKGYSKGIRMIEPERLPAIVEALLRRGWKDDAVKGLLGGNNLRVAEQVWKPNA